MNTTEEPVGEQPPLRRVFLYEALGITAEELYRLGRSQAPADRRTLGNLYARYVQRMGRWRDHLPLTEVLRAQLLRIEPTSDDWYPCRLVFRDDQTLDRVYVMEDRAWLLRRGILFGEFDPDRGPIPSARFWPEDQRDSHVVSIADVARIEESRVRVPAPLARRMYAADESEMGYYIFTLVFDDGRRVACGTAAVDFPGLPPDVRTEMMVDLVPHEGRNEPIIPAPTVWLCLYSLDPRLARSGSG